MFLVYRCEEYNEHLSFDADSLVAVYDDLEAAQRDVLDHITDDWTICRRHGRFCVHTELHSDRGGSICYMVAEKRVTQNAMPGSTNGSL